MDDEFDEFEHSFITDANFRKQVWREQFEYLRDRKVIDWDEQKISDTLEEYERKHQETEHQETE